MASNSFSILASLPDGASHTPASVRKVATRRDQRPPQPPPRAQRASYATAGRGGGRGGGRRGGGRSGEGGNSGGRGGTSSTASSSRKADGRQHHGQASSHRSVPKWKSPAPSIVVSDPSAVGAAVRTLSKHSRIAVDCEGVALSRTGALCLVQVASVDAVYLFDVVVGGRALFDAGLRDLLESPSCVKVVHDCRHDCDALFHQYDVRLAPVLDTQVSFAVLRSVRKLPVGLPVALKTLLRKFCGVSEDDLAVKESIKTAMRERATFWLDRPMDAASLAYARFDVVYLIHVAAVMALHITSANKGGWERVLRESEEYSRLFRDDADGPRKESARWARMVTEAKVAQATRDRRKAATELQAVDPMRTFAFDRARVLHCLRS
jgi:hypothetical protein